MCVCVCFTGGGGGEDMKEVCEMMHDMGKGHIMRRRESLGKDNNVTKNRRQQEKRKNGIIGCDHTHTDW